ncbi:MAG: hypothetical protein IPG89_08860 [Bacteroidetes bacterium]|nr:hypothetical protein [Bacteroidota bacterium]
MKYFLIYAFCSLLTLAVHAKGGSGIYYIKGIAYKSDSTTIKNQEIKVKIGKHTKVFKTDSIGAFELEIPWETVCPSGISAKERTKGNSRLNPHLISITCSKLEIIIENEWKKYAKLFPETKEEVTLIKDLYFKQRE